MVFKFSENDFDHIINPSFENKFISCQGIIIKIIGQHL